MTFCRLNLLTQLIVFYAFSDLETLIKSLLPGVNSAPSFRQDLLVVCRCYRQDGLIPEYGRDVH